MWMKLRKWWRWKRKYQANAIVRVAVKYKKAKRCHRNHLNSRDGSVAKKHQSRISNCVDVAAKWPGRARQRAPNVPLLLPLLRSTVLPPSSSECLNRTPSLPSIKFRQFIISFFFYLKKKIRSYHYFGIHYHHYSNDSSVKGLRQYFWMAIESKWR